MNVEQYRQIQEATVRLVAEARNLAEALERGGDVEAARALRAAIVHLEEGRRDVGRLHRGALADQTRKAFQPVPSGRYPI